jgi:hypothetical protein
VLAAVFPLCWDIWEIDNQKISLEHERKPVEKICIWEPETNRITTVEKHIPARAEEEKEVDKTSNLVYTLCSL